MAGQIPQRFLDDLLARVDVVEVVGERVKLKKAGRNYSGLCPFHQEKTPSFTVSADKQFYHCFGCGAHGNALRFLMEYDKLRFPEAVEQLADRLGYRISYEGGVQVFVDSEHDTMQFFVYFSSSRYSSCFIVI